LQDVSIDIEQENKPRTTILPLALVAAALDDLAGGFDVAVDVAFFFAGVFLAAG